MRRTRQSDYVALSPSLSHRSFTVGLWAQPLVLFDYPNLGAVNARPGDGWPITLCGKNRKRFILSNRIADRLSPHHDSQFSAFSTEVFDQTN